MVLRECGDRNHRHGNTPEAYGLKWLLTHKVQPIREDPQEGTSMTREHIQVTARVVQSIWIEW